MLFSKVFSGAHLRAIRNWMIANVQYGDQVEWGSNTIIRPMHHLRVNSMEQLSQTIANAVFQDIKKDLKICNKFEFDPSIVREKNVINLCKNCGHKSKFHVEFYGQRL